LPLACSFEGVKRQLGVLLALALFLVYYSVYSIGMTMAESGILNPGTGLWGANILFAAMAVAGLHLAYKERAPSITRLLHHWRAKLRKHNARAVSH
jgi:lipopolysaccharide export system permease protein